MMIKNYITVAFRNFLRNKNYTLINILGLSIGITSCIIIFLLISYEMKFDKFHSRYDRIYRVVRKTTSASGIHEEAITPYPFGRAFRNDFPDVPLMTQFHFAGEGVLTIGEDKQKVEQILFADSLFFKVFDFGIVSGNPEIDLGEPNKLFLTESLAAKLNLQEHSRVKLDNKLDLEVAGIINDPPASSHIQYAMIVSMPSFTEEYFGWPVDHWGLTSKGFSYLVLPEGVSTQQLTDRLKPFVSKYYDDEEEKRNEYGLQPLKDIHFDTTYSETPATASNVDSNDLFILGVLGVFILVIGCINFINLATALAVKKSKEIGIRKTLGAKRAQLTTYFLCETLLLTLFSMVISLGLAEWVLPWLRGFLEKDVYLNLFSDSSLIIFLGALAIVATLFSGFYPAVILSGFDPVTVLKNKITARGASSSFVRKFLVVFQFLIAQVMIISVLVVSDQMEYFNSKPLGFTHNAVINVPLPGNEKSMLDNFRSRLEANANVQHVSFAIGAPTAESNIGTEFLLADSEGGQGYSVRIKTVDSHYMETYGLELTAGRWFYESEEKRAADTTIKNDERFAFVVNEAAVRKLGFSNSADVIGKRIRIGLNDAAAPIIGVVKDFHMVSLRDEISPLVIMNYPELYYDAGIAINTENMPATIAFVKKTWTELYPNYLFEYEFLDEHLAELYRQEGRQLMIFRIFAGISIFIGCLGLLGLVSFMANQRTKEIGVRKVFGASLPGIVGSFAKEFVRLVLVAFIFAAPLTWMLMSRWLENFQYHVAIHWSVFTIGLTVTIAIALVTVSYRSMTASLANPIDSLRSE